MPECPHCGFDISLDWSYCPECTKQLNHDSSQSQILENSVVQGDVTNVSNIYQTNERVTCEQCEASGNLTIFKCTEMNCENQFCEYCVDDESPQSCRTCIEKKRLEKKIEIEKIRQREEIEAHRLEKLRIESEQRKKEMRQQKDLVNQQRLAEQKRVDQKRLAEQKRIEAIEKKKEKTIKKKKEKLKNKIRSRNITIFHFLGLLFLIPTTFLFSMEHEKYTDSEYLEDEYCFTYGSDSSMPGATYCNDDAKEKISENYIYGMAFLPFIYIGFGLTTLVVLSLIIRFTHNKKSKKTLDKK